MLHIISASTRPGWKDAAETTNAVTEYVDHIHSLSRQDPGLLLAHAWTQYSALASGGQAIKRMVAKAFRHPEGRGTAMFDFGEDKGVRGHTQCCV